MKKNSAFTLVELAIVLIIIGLITGGVVGAQSLIDSAARSNLYQDVIRYETAMNAFRLEYDAIPGDFNEATAYWGGTVANGNNSKKVDTMTEALNVWEHLSRAEILPSNYDGTGTSLADNNAPRNGDYGFYYLPYNPMASTSSSASWLATTRLPSSALAITTSSASASANNVATTYESDDYSAQSTGLNNDAAKKIDKKYDDDDPLRGIILAPICTMADHTPPGGGEYFSPSLSSFNETYLLTNVDPACVMTFLINL